MEINKEREAFEASLTKMKIHNLRVGTIFDTEKNEYFASDVLHPSEDHIVGWINFSWKLWQEKATPEGFVLDAPARVGGGVFRKGVKWKTVIESAQRLYEHSKDEIKPIVSPADMLKIANGELVLVPRDQITCFYQDNDEPENFCNSTSGFDSLGDCIDLGDIMQINKHKQANISTEKLYGTWVADTGNPLERSRYKFFVGTEFECEEIVLENERVFEEAQEQSHDSQNT